MEKKQNACQVEALTQEQIDTINYLYHTESITIKNLSEQFLMGDKHDEVKKVLLSEKEYRIKQKRKKGLISKIR